MASIRTDLKVTNNTPLSMVRIWVTDTDNYDWDGGSRPDHNFQNVSLAAYDSREEREELNYWASSAWYRLHIQFQNGDTVSFRNDQYDARHDHKREIGLDGASADKYIATQLSGDDWNKITISLRLPTSSWMDKLAGNSKLSELNIPGTHDTCALYGGDLAICQTQTLQEQLEAGIRFIDIRCRHIENRFAIHHGIMYQHLMFGGGVRDVCLKFLEDHPRETIIMSVKHEYEDADDTRSFEDTFRWYLEGNESMWYLDETIPSLDEVRGKIVLLRRFKSNLTLGIDATAWKDDATFSIESSYAVLRIQDEYKVPTVFNIGNKWDHVKSLLDKAVDGAQSDWYLNFTSGTSAGAYPYTVAEGSPGIEGLNSRLYGYLDQTASKRIGTLIMDFPNKPIPSLVERIIASNKFSL
ncbi:phosphatidylinositol-specific phospholipase C [Paenibacillus sp. SC116]|uniref:phosphatidylinositol-specific phospholipase C n=1 Tax=Paenibacillus sp. SC116 TaxID=2968986 RepID=UPI00215ADC90|nr:phosphatidylinositol-specific phospholipase C [Paenibacillus sp. SC116]MCR8842423.1 phosphatidylinositol-specific phospholipase C [Paenibacillus sp. SC116]